jgi:F-type H+-transporting ATPase subunit gamma
MTSLRELRRRIRSIENTAQITRAMQMVAASKMRKAQQSALAVTPFARMLYRIQRAATRQLDDFEHPLLERREVKRRAVILVGSDKGLCGPLNTNVFRLASRFDPATTVFIAAGRRSAQFVARSGRQLLAEFPYGDSPAFAESRGIARFTRELFLAREVDEVLVVTTRFVNTLVQEPMTIEYLPVGDIKGMAIPGVPFTETPPAPSPLLEPSAEDLLAYLLGHYLNIYIHVVLLNAKASELSARMVSMKNATESAEELIEALTLEGNKLRQSNVTRELLEIAGGRTG